MTALTVPAGSWVRRRDLPRVFASRRTPPRLEPEWCGAWHLASGDLRYRRSPRGGDVSVVARCGHELPTLMIDVHGVPFADVAIADTEPGVDVCRRCARYAGEELASSVGEPELVSFADQVATAKLRLLRMAGFFDAPGELSDRS